MSDKNLLESIGSPADLKKLGIQQLETLAQEIRESMVSTVSRTGGHLSSSLGAVELCIALHYVFDAPEDSIVFDVGHQAYAHKMLTGRLGQMSGLRHSGGISGFPKRSESPYDAFGVGHSSTSISAALGMAVGDSLNGHKQRWHVAVIGDGALTGGMAVEALNHAGVYKKDTRLLIILNDNNCSISPPVGALSNSLGRLVSSAPFWKARNLGKSVLKHTPVLWNLAKTMEKQTVNFISPFSSIFSSFDLNYFGPIDGHDIEQLVTMLSNIRNLDGGPMVLHIVTRKGKGYKPAEDDPTLYHGVSAFNPETGIVPSANSAPTYTNIFSDWICDMAAADPSLYAITPAMREGSGLVEFERRYPDRYRDVAIAEQHAVTYAAGLACAGVHPVVAIYSTFAQRAYDQIAHDVALQNLPVLFAIDRGGLVGADGPTHHGVFDMAYLRSLPNMTIMAPSDEDECRKMLTTGFRMNSPVAVRYPRGRGPGVWVGRDLESIPVGKSRLIRKVNRIGAKHVTILSFGAPLRQARVVAEEIDAELVDMRFVKPLDMQAIERAAQQSDLIVTIEEGCRQGGAGSAVLEAVADLGYAVPVCVIGIPDRFVEHGDTADVLASCGLDAQSIKKTIAERLARLARR